MKIADVLIPALRTRFPSQTMAFGPPPGIVVFRPICPDVGDLTIFDDGEEATVLVEHITHHHVNPYDLELTEEQRVHWITEQVVRFLDDLFADRVLLRLR